MISKFIKTIHNHYLKFFKIFYFLRYLFPIFLLAIILYISIPKFFNYENKEIEIKNFLSKNYQLNLNKFSSITYKIFPLPNIYLENVDFTFKNKSNYFNSKKMYIFLNISNIYNRDKFISEKMIIRDNEMNLKASNLDYLIDLLDKIKPKLVIKNLDLNITKNNESILNIKNITFKNYGFKKNRVQGEVFEKKFKIKVNKNNKEVKFKIIDTGISANFKFNEKKKNKSITGTSKINILNNYLKLNYLVNKNQIIIDRSKFRNKDLLVTFQTLIKLNPFFEMNSNIKIDKINDNLFYKLNLEKILEKKDIIKKLNSKNKIEYKEKKILQFNLINQYNSELYIENGRMNELSSIRIPGAKVNCQNEIMLTEDYPRLYFKCNFNLVNNNKFNKFFAISKKLDDRPFNLSVKGSLNILRKKINFENLSINDFKYDANEEDKIFFKKSFEEILFSEGFFNIFKTKKIKYFLNEIF